MSVLYRAFCDLADAWEERQRAIKESEEMQHDYPACATFRGGQCTCDEADKLCPKCGSEEWTRIPHKEAPDTAECDHCQHEWTLPMEIWK